jgi:hypothetical protein
MNSFVFTRSAVAGFATSLFLAGGARAQSVDIPLQLQEGSIGPVLAANVGIVLVFLAFYARFFRRP